MWRATEEWKEGRWEAKWSETERPEFHINPILFTCLSLIHLKARLLHTFVCVVDFHTRCSVLPVVTPGVFTLVTLQSHSGTATPSSPKDRPFPARTETFVHVSPGLKKQKNAGSGKDISFFRRNSSAELLGSLDQRLPVPHACGVPSDTAAVCTNCTSTLECLMPPDHLMDQVEALAVTFTYVLHFHWINLFTISKKIRWSLAVDIDWCWNSSSRSVQCLATSAPLHHQVNCHSAAFCPLSSVFPRCHCNASRALLYALTLAVFAVDCSCVSIKMARSDWTAYAPFNGNNLSKFLLFIFFYYRKTGTETQLVRFQLSLISDANNKVFQSYVIIMFALCVSWVVWPWRTPSSLSKAFSKRLPGQEFCRVNRSEWNVPMYCSNDISDVLLNGKYQVMSRHSLTEPRRICLLVFLATRLRKNK